MFFEKLTILFFKFKGTKSLHFLRTKSKLLNKKGITGPYHHRDDGSLMRRKKGFSSQAMKEAR